LNNEIEYSITNCINIFQKEKQKEADPEAETLPEAEALLEVKALPEALTLCWKRKRCKRKRKHPGWKRKRYKF
jgi:hypothetical protein